MITPQHGGSFHRGDVRGCTGKNHFDEQQRLGKLCSGTGLVCAPSLLKLPVGKQRAELNFFFFFFFFFLDVTGH
jgi:hypothetical protein